MQIHRDISNLPPFTNAVITIGSFDGVHRGHQKIIKRIKSLANEIGGESVLITFYPHPRQIIYPKDNSLQLLSTLEEKIHLMEKYGVDHLVVVPFSIEFSQQLPREYVEKFLIDCFNPSYIVLGYDHRFGLNREGDIRLLRMYESEGYFKVVEIYKQELDDITISSTKIREALRDGEVAVASKFLNHHYLLSGKVIRGDEIGVKLGFPTANLKLNNKDKLIPMEGIYAVRVFIEDLKYDGMMYIGNRPTINNKGIPSIEVNIFNFKADIYEQVIAVELVAFLRSDEKYDDLEDLKKQLNLDKMNAKLALERMAESIVEDRAMATVAILNYNGEEYLETFLPAVLYSSSAPTNYAVIDNASEDGSQNYLNYWHPEVELIELSKNYGFAEGYNRGMIYIKTKYTVLLNSDVLVEANWLDPIIEMLEKDETLAAVQPKILSLEDKTRFEYAGAAGGYIDVLGYPFCQGRIMDTSEEDEGQYNQENELFWASGAAMVIRTDVFKNIGGFDRDFFAHHEEIDLCWRINRAGYTIKSCPSAIVYHLGGGTLDYDNPKKVYLNFRNNLSTIIKNSGSYKLLWLFPLRLILDGVAGIMFLLQGKPNNTLSIIKAHFYIYGHLRHIWRKRALYNRQIAKISIGSPNYSGMKPIILIWEYFIRGKKTFSDIFH